MSNNSLNIFDQLKKACVELISTLPKLNEAQRNEMRIIMLQLKQDLTGSLVVAEQYLIGVKRSTREKDILEQMYNAPGRLLNTYNELKICTALYNLNDRFNQWFNSISTAINTSNLSDVKKLINRIADGEQYIVSELQEVLRKLPNYAQKIENSSNDEKTWAIDETHKYVNRSLATLRKAEVDVKGKISAVLKLM